MNKIGELTAESRKRMIDTLKRTKATLKDVIRQNELLAEDPDRRQSAQKRVNDGQLELEIVEHELRNLREGRSLGDGRT